MLTTSEKSCPSTLLRAATIRGVLRGQSKGVVFTEIFLNFLFLFLPLLHMPNIFNPYEFPKFVFFVGGVFLLLLLNLRRLWSPSTTFKIDTLTKLVLLYGFVVYLADVLGLDPKTSFLGSQFRHQGFITLASGILLFLITRHSLNGRNDYNGVIRGIILGAFFVCLLSIWQGIPFYLFHDLRIPTYQGRIVGTMGNPNSLAGYLAIVLPFALFNKNKIIKLILSFLIVVVVIFTDSRSAFLAVGFVFLIYGARFLVKSNISRVAKAIIFILVFIVLIKFVDYTFHKNIVGSQVPKIVERGCPESWIQVYTWTILRDIYNSKIFNFAREAPCDNRLLVWTMGLETLNKSPILGFGQENFEIAVDPGKMHSVDNAHNIFLETAISSGLLGLLAFLSVIFVALKRANLVIGLSLLAFLIVASFNPLSIAEIALFWFLLGISTNFKITSKRG